ncbi:sugar-transfer associated ATP-grasp domain-containing protein [Tissierella praeacuta]|uniref:sugar-transfer associated ATP-grasp domain-containing protein n=1 Tax=Tissierella praeacuta TaxID=43131 RepID=UPI0033405C9D
MRSNARKGLDTLFGIIESNYRAIQYRRAARKRLRRMNGGYKCSVEYKSVVLPYWRQFNVKPKEYWYSLYSADSRKVDPRYIPDDLWFGKIIPYFSNMQFRRACEDKCMHSIWFSELKRPRTFVMNIAGIFYDENYNIISKDDAVDICLNNKKFLIKPSIDSGEGRLISFFDDETVTDSKILSVFDSLNSNFIAQEIINQHSALAKINEKSLNTIRVVSLLFKGEVHILSAILRMGGSESRVDNVGAGGYACKINDDGKLNQFGVNRKSEWSSKHPNGTLFSDVSVPSYKKIIETIKREHIKLAHFKIIGWDFGVDIDNDPVFIEYNTCPGQNQMTCGPTFGNLTEDVLEDVFIKKTLEGSKN